MFYTIKNLLTWLQVLYVVTTLGTACSKRSDQRVDIKPKPKDSTVSPNSATTGPSARLPETAPGSDGSAFPTGNSPGAPSYTPPATDSSSIPSGAVTDPSLPNSSDPSTPDAMGSGTDSLSDPRASDCAGPAVAAGDGSGPTPPDRECPDSPLSSGGTFDPDAVGTGSSPWARPEDGGVGGVAGGPDPAAFGGSSAMGGMGTMGAGDGGGLSASLGNFFAAMAGHANTVDPDKADVYGLLGSFSRSLPIDTLFQNPAGGGYLSCGGNIGSGYRGNGFLDPAGGWNGANSGLPSGTTDPSFGDPNQRFNPSPGNTPEGFDRSGRDRDQRDIQDDNTSPSDSPNDPTFDGR